MERSQSIFGNHIPDRIVRKAERGKQKYVKQYGDDSQTPYHLSLSENEVLNDLGTKQFVLSDRPFDVESVDRPVVIGNIRMGFGHYRISMAMCSAARALGYTPLWLDLNSFPETTCTKIIAHQNDLYSLGSRLSQKFGIFNRLVWEPMNSEGFRKLSYNAADQKNAELMAPVLRDLPADLPFVATHVWPAQAAVHHGMTHVVNAIPDNWQMGLHLAEGSIHTVQTPSAYLGYRVLRGMDGGHLLNPIPAGQLYQTGHYIDHELVATLENDCKLRISRASEGKPLRYLLTVGGAGAQQALFASIIKHLLAKVEAQKATLLINVGDHANVLSALQKEIPALNAATLHTEYGEIRSFCADALSGEVNGIHCFMSEEIFTAVYATNLLMRCSDLLITKPSELAFYPIPKLFIHRVGGHEAWGAIHSAELGDGTNECTTLEETLQMLDLLDSDRSIHIGMCNAIQAQNKIGTYNGAYEVIRLATTR